MASNSHSFINCASFLNVGAVHQLDEGQISCLVDFVAKLQTFHIEFDAYSPIARLPRYFVREFGDKISSCVILRDPNLNEFEVRVVKKADELCFEEGWFGLRDTYNIWFGGWVSFTYVNPKLLTISVITRWGAEVRYPASNPPLKRMLPQVRYNRGSGSVSPTTSLAGRFDPKCFVRSYFKKLTAYDVHSRILVLPWYGFGESVFAYTFSDFNLVDYAGNKYQCTLQCGVDGNGELCCKVSGGGWIDLCKRHCIREGDRVRFAVAEPSSNYVVYVCVYPQVGIETVLCYPLNDGSHLPLYVSQQYFVADY